MYAKNTSVHTCLGLEKKHGNETYAATTIAYKEQSFGFKGD